MKKILLPVAAIAATLAFVGLRHEPLSSPGAEVFASPPPHFEPAGASRFAARAAGFALELDDSGSRMRLARGTRSASVSLQLEGASPSGARPENLLPGVSNYFIGDDPRTWRIGVPHYARVRYENVYPGVDLVYYGAQGKLEYDFLVAPGADPQRIRMRYDGAQSLRLDGDGNLRIAVDGGELVHERPVSWQQVDGIRQRVHSAFRILREAGATLVAFELGDYDAGLPLTIDPVLTYATYLGGTDDNDDAVAIAVDDAGAVYAAGFSNSVDLAVTAGVVQPARAGSFDAYVAKLNPAGTAYEYLTYLGGTGLDEPHVLRIDAAGNAYLAGETSSVDFPTTASAAQPASGGLQDVFVAKLNATGGALLYSTYLGGTGSEPGSQNICLEVDPDGDAFVAGDTDSTDFPTSPGAPQESRGNPDPLAFDQDMFLTRINADGTAFAFSTYLGGTGIEENDVTAEDIRLLAIDDAGSAWVAGTTESADFPATPGSLQATFGGPAGGIPGGGDAFVARYDTDAGTLAYATFVGGNEDEFAMALAVDSAGNAYLAANTESADFPTTAGSADTTQNGSSDVGLVKISPDGSALVYGTFLGAGLQDVPMAMRLDSTGRAYVAGETDSFTFPVTAGAADTTHNGGADGFVARLNAAGTAFDYVTFAGSSDDESVFLLEIDAAGSAYALMGDMVGDGFLTAGARAHSGVWDDYFVKVSPAGDSFLDASYLGGTEDDYSLAMAVDADENLYLHGITSSSDFPVTAAVPQPAKAGDPGDEDTFIAKLATTPAGPVVQPGSLSLSATTYTVNENGGNATITVTRSGGSAGAVGVTCTASAAGGDTASAGVDFTAATVTLSWADGDAANKTCAVPVGNDTDVENAETFTVTLSNATGGASLGTNTSAAVTINDDDVTPLPEPGTVQFDPASVSVSENGGSVTLTLTRTAGADGAISVSVTTGGGSASAGADYDALDETVSWADGDAASRTVTLTVLDDAIDESNETVTIGLSNGTGDVTLGAGATVTITDNDVTPPPATQSSNAKGRYGGALDGILVGVLLMLAGGSLFARHRRSRRRALHAATLPASSAAVALCLASAAQAGDFYVGARAGLAQSTQEAADIDAGLTAEGHDVSVTLDDEQPTYTLFGGFRWANGFAVEASVFDLGEYEVAVEAETSSPSGLLADTETLLGDGGRGVSAALAWTWNAGRYLEITPRIGAYYWESGRSVQSEAGRLEDREFGVDLMGGISFDFRVAEHWRLGLGWEAWAADGRNDVQAVIASLSYHFGE